MAKQKKKVAKKARKKRVRVCDEAGCRELQTTSGFCRLHYIKNWREIVQERKLKAREKLSKFVEGMSERYGDDYVEVLQDTMGSDEQLKNRLHEFGFREEFESGDKNPFEATAVRELLSGLNSDD